MFPQFMLFYSSITIPLDLKDTIKDDVDYYEWTSILRVLTIKCIFTETQFLWGYNGLSFIKYFMVILEEAFQLMLCLATQIVLSACAVDSDRSVTYQM